MYRYFKKSRTPKILLLGVVCCIMGCMLWTLQKPVPAASYGQLTNSPSANPKVWILAMVRMDVIYGDKNTNLKTAEKIIAQAAANGAELVLFPECIDTGSVEAFRQLAQPVPDGETCRRLMRAARKHRVFVSAGISETEGDNFYSTAVLINPDGTLESKYRKINAAKDFQTGNNLSIADTKLGKIGLLFSDDALANDAVLTKALCSMGADVILSPCINLSDSLEFYQLWHQTFSPIANQFHVTIAAVQSSNGNPILRDLIATPEADMSPSISDQNISYRSVIVEPRN